MHTIKHIFFDLDHTLWDHRLNTQKALQKLYDKYLGHKAGEMSVDLFIQCFRKHNQKYWTKLKYGNISKETFRIQRFQDILEEYNQSHIDLQTVQQLSSEFTNTSPKGGILITEAANTLEYLHQKEYSLHIITNGFSDVQKMKLEYSGILDYFNVIVCSDHVQQKKPHPKIFEYALYRSGARAHESMMIGDNAVADIKGGLKAGMRTIFYNPNRNEEETQSTYVIDCLSQIQNIL